MSNLVKALQIIANANPKGCNQYKPCSTTGKTGSKGQQTLVKGLEAKKGKQVIIRGRGDYQGELISVKPHNKRDAVVQISTRYSGIKTSVIQTGSQVKLYKSKAKYKTMAEATAARYKSEAKN